MHYFGEDVFLSALLNNAVMSTHTSDRIELDDANQFHAWFKRLANTTTTSPSSSSSSTPSEQPRVATSNLSSAVNRVLGEYGVPFLCFDSVVRSAIDKDNDLKMLIAVGRIDRQLTNDDIDIRSAVVLGNEPCKRCNSLSKGSSSVSPPSPSPLSPRRKATSAYT